MSDAAELFLDSKISPLRKHGVAESIGAKQRSQFSGMHGLRLLGETVEHMSMEVGFTTANS